MLNSEETSGLIETIAFYLYAHTHKHKQTDGKIQVEHLEGHFKHAIKKV